MIYLVLEFPITSFCENSGICLAWNRGINLKHRQLGRERKLFGVIYECFHLGFKNAEAKAMKKKQKKKGVVQQDVDLEVDSPAHSILRLVTPGKHHSPTAGMARFGKITRRGKPSAHMI